MRQAFVIMPFGGEFDPIYSLFIMQALTEAGYRVVRADDIRNHQNILKDVLAGIIESELVVADLTGSNPNVYYELGVAHAFAKRVILLTQKLDELPFDLKSYRVITYATHFAEMSKAHAQLVAAAKDALEDRVAFGSPVSDFIAIKPARVPLIVEGISQSVSDGLPGEAGILDFLVDLENGFEKLGDIINSNTADTSAITEAMADATGRLNDLKQSRSSVAGRRLVMVSLANKLVAYSEKLSQNNRSYADTLSMTRRSLESVIRAQSATTEDEKEQLQTFLSQLDRMRELVQRHRTSLGELIDAVNASPRVERTYNRAVDVTVKNLEGYAQNVDQTLSMIVRARELTNSRLAESN